MLLCDLYEKIVSFSMRNKRVFLYGTGKIGKTLRALLQSRGQTIDGFIQTADKEQDEIDGCRVYTYDEIEDQLTKEDSIILALSYQYHAEVLENIKGFRGEVLRLEPFEVNAVINYWVDNENWDERKNTEISSELFSREEKRRLSLLKERETVLRKYKEKYDFPDWHMGIVDEYAYETADYIAKKCESIHYRPVVLECGCGLCNIIGNTKLNNCRRIGVDIRESIINTDKELYGNSIEFRIGSFGDICGEDIDFFISVNFLHGIVEERLRSIYETLFSNNEIKYYIADEVTGNYTYLHHIQKLLPDMYSLEDSIGPFPADGGVRYIRVFKRV